MNSVSLSELHSSPENIEENLLDPDEGNHMLCKACTLPIFSTPLINDDTDFPLHKDCANLPKELKHVLHPREPLVLLGRSWPHYGYIKCHNCSKQCKGFIYQCPDSTCQMALDVLRAVPLGTIKILHRSHKHELVPISSDSLFNCGACQSDHRGLSYLCDACGFWIHRDCALLPNKIQHKRHDSAHLLTLTYSSDMRSRRFFPHLLLCAICPNIVTRLGMYTCTRCKYVAHIKCATWDPESLSPVLKGHMGDSSLLHLPMMDEKTSLIRYLLENTTSNTTKEKDSILAEKFFDGKHEHPLIYHDHTSTNDDHKLCNGCVKPISPPFYSCPKCSDFSLHSCCANLPLKFWHPDYRKRLLLHPKTEDFLSKFTCHGCKRDCNGFVYTNKRIVMDVECTLLPNSITHEAHPKTHILFMTNYIFFTVFGADCQCCGAHLSSICYECSGCRHFRLHARTKYDDYFCEFCEQSINTNRWFYGCDDCSNWFHVDCIPSVSRLSKIRFGGTIRLWCHDCPLTSIRLLTEYSHTCGICQNTVQGFMDEIAFECAKCNFRVHYDCAKKHRVI